MDIFKGIGDFFGGLFGQKKKREDEQQQPQQQQSAVSFNNTPKLGDNFVNNLSNPTQPQQPKEFAKSSVDLNPVKPVQPVQPQPQVNRDQERQQLANKYRQEETDRYNQGSDHAANFLNDIFSGGKTAQMRENTINQNIQNRVNAEMLRKYGPDDQQVKQNIAQTSQNINKNATAVSDFTKNYNNNVQQTVVAPVSAVKGAANSVAEFVPKVSGAITELGANTIKLFDEDNQFANNLIKRVRADREKNIVRKTLNDATGLTDQDNKMAYGLGSSGARMAIDAAMTPVTGGLAPAVVYGVEAHSDMMDHLDNIEARKKAEAAAKGETYTPSSFTSRYLASTANAGAQAAIEKLGIDNLTGKIGGKFAKNMVGRAITGALGEAGEEAAQQYAENFTKKLFDNKQDIHEGVAESALMGGIMGGAGKMAFGGMESVKNPYKSNNMADGEVSISKLHPDQMGYNKDAVLGKFTGDTRKRMSERSFNMLQDLRANNPYVTGDGDALTLSRAGNSKITRTSTPIPDDLFMAKMRTTPRINQIIENSIKTHSAPDFKNHKIAPDGFNYYNAPINISGKRYDMGFDVAVNNDHNTNTIYNSNIRKAPDLVSYDANGNDTELKSNAYDSNIAQKDQKVNAFNREYEPEIQDLQNVYQKYGDDFEFNLTPEQQVIYEHLLRESPRDSEGRYIDPVTSEITIDQIVDYDGNKAVKITDKLPDYTDRSAVRKQILNKFKDVEFPLNEIDQTAGVNRNSAGKLSGPSYKGQPESHIETKVNSSMYIDELGLVMKNIREEIPNNKNNEANAPKYLKGETTIINDGRAYDADLVIRQYPDGSNKVYDVIIKKEITAPHAPMRENAPEPLVPRAGLEDQQRVIDGYSYTEIISQNSKKINNEQPSIDGENSRKTRKFAETVLDTDTPPKDFVKLMHAGDESLKYTPKKNSELWNRATKSVQESPERVFNELENTRVANDDTMAKGIALAKHYQAMGDDLKASELYVELAKKATEAGRTVQALNLMRRTTPEGVLMSTMREVESYNDKMKNKPNKQINITPEQRAEFLGRLREAYAMPEGDLKEIRARRIAIGEAIREVRDQIPSSKWDKFTTLWKAGLLTAPTTHIRNIAGNIINGGSEKTAQTIGSAFDWMIGKGTGKAYNFFTRFY